MDVYENGEKVSKTGITQVKYFQISQTGIIGTVSIKYLLLLISHPFI